MNSIIENNQDLTVAVKNGDISAVKTFLKNGVDVNAMSGHSTTLLYWACLEGHTDIVSRNRKRTPAGKHGINCC